MMLEPGLAITSRTRCLAPFPTVTIPITAMTSMIIPPAASNAAQQVDAKRLTDREEVVQKNYGVVAWLKDYSAIHDKKCSSGLGKSRRMSGNPSFLT